MALLKSWRTTPPGGWVYRQAETLFDMKAENGEALIDLVVAHRNYKGLTPVDRASVKLDIERQICVTLSSNECRKERPSDPWVPQQAERPIFTMSAVIGFSRAAWAFLKSGMKLVPKSEAERRASICKGCSQNREMHGCSCGKYHELIAAAIPEDRKIDGIFVCWACGCDLKSKVNLEESVIVASDAGRDIQFPSFCWQKEILDRHAGRKAE